MASISILIQILTTLTNKTSIQNGFHAHTLHKTSIQNGFHAHTLQAWISQEVSEWYVFSSTLFYNRSNIWMCPLREHHVRT